MASPMLTVSSVLSCPHEGTVKVVPSHASVQAGSLVVTATSVATVTGCTNSPPCASVVWQVPDTRVKVAGAPSVSEARVGTCLSATGTPQGSVSVKSNQAKASSQ